MFFPPPPPRSAEEAVENAPSRTSWRVPEFDWICRHPWWFAAAFTLSWLLIASVLPIWTAWYIGSWEASGERASFWEMLEAMPRAAEQVGWQRLVLDFHETDLVELVVLAVAGVGIGRTIPAVLRKFVNWQKGT